VVVHKWILIAALAACTKSPERTQPVQRDVRPGAPAADGPPAAAPEPSEPNGPPPGSEQLVRVPVDIADQLELREVAHGLARPVALVAAPDDPRRRLFIVEQHVGRIRILEGGTVAQKPFFQIGGLSTGNEEGLLGLAFHPKFAQNRKLYVNYTAKNMATRIVEYQVSASNPDAVDMASAKLVIEIAQPYSNHNGGHLLFGPDGKLYTGMGDGGSAGDPQRNGQNPSALLAKLLRFDVDVASPQPEIVHVGLRNPWRFWFDRVTGDLFIGDVGQNEWENVYAVKGGDTTRHNFGWNVVEGNHCFGARSCERDSFTRPVADYPHDEGCSVTGGVTYRGKALPMLAGRYFYADYCTGLLRSFAWPRGYVREHWDWKPVIDRKGILGQISSFGVDHDGEIYIVELTGSIFKLVPRS
jgi:glucose/arabinose dehydrogenase